VGYPEKRGKGKDAYYRARYKVRDGVYGTVKDDAGETVRFTTKRDAQKAADDAEADVRAGRWIDPDKSATPVGEWYTAWRAAQRYARANTAETYDRAWRLRVEPRWGTVALGEILPIDVQRWEAELLDRHGGSSTVNIASTVFRQLIEDAYANQMIKFLPLPPQRRKSTTPTPRTAPVGVNVPLTTWEQICARMELPRDRLVARMPRYTGMRKSEVLAMRRRFLTVTRATAAAPASARYYLHPDVGKLEWDTSGRPSFAPPKSGPGREWRLPPFVAQWLIDHLDYLDTLPSTAAIGGRQSAKYRDCEILPEWSDLLFFDANGRPLNGDSWMATKFRPACDGRPETKQKDEWEPIWPGLRMHDGKHSFADTARDLGIHEVLLDYLMGHDSGSVQSVYSRPTEEMWARLLREMQAWWETYEAQAAFSQISPSDLTGAVSPSTVDASGAGHTQDALFLS
jgi:integrase